MAIVDMAAVGSLEELDPRPVSPSGSAPQLRPAGARSVLLAGLGPALLTLMVCLYDLHLPHVLYGTHEYDDGVYMGAALRFVEGVMPYRDFVIVHPPGIVLLMTPFAALGSVFGSDAAMAMARDLTALVAAANVLLAAAVVRHRGWKVSLGAAMALACFPMTPAAHSTLLLEPYLVFFSLLGLVLLFRDGALAPPKRVLLAGLVFGLGGSVKIWGAFVVAALALTFARQMRTVVVPLVSGAALGFLLPCLPFVAMAPRRFFTDVLGDQFQRVASGSEVMSWSERIFVLSGFPGLTVVLPSAAIAVACAAVFLAVVTGAYVGLRRSVGQADRAVLAMAAGSVAPMWAATDIYPHYIYFPAAFMAPLFALSLSVLFRWAVSRRGGPAGGPWLRTSLTTGVAGLLALAAASAAFSIPQQAGYARSHLTSAADSNFLNLRIAPGQCIVSDDSSVLVTADLYRRPPTGCPTVVDAYGIFLASWPGHEPPSLSMGRVPVRVPQVGTPPPAFVNEWAGWLSRADWVIELSQISSYIPWTPQLRQWFAHDFKLSMSHGGLWVYQHVERTAPPVDRLTD